MKQTHMPYGAVTAIAMAVLGLIFWVMGISFKPGVQYLTQVPFLIGIILNAIAFSKANEADVTFGQVFSSCFKASAIITIISLIWVLIMNLIFPEMKEKGMEIAQQKMLEQGLTEDKVEQGMAVAKKFFNVFMVAGVVFGTMFYGLVFSLIGALVAKKKAKAAPLA